MNGLLEWLPMTLVRTTLVTSVAATAALVLLRLLRINRPEVHRTVWLLVVLQGWMLAVWTWELEGAPLPPARPAAALDMEITTTVAPPTLSGPEPARIVKVNWQAVVRQGQVALWVGGAAVLLVIGSRRYLRLARGPLGEPVDRDDWRTEWRETLGESKVAGAELRITQTLGPLICWVPWTYRVLAPRDLWTRLEPRERLLVLRHELAHCERGDLWKNLLVRLLALPQWFNPLVWVAVRRFEEAGEWACDERVAGQSGRATDYARTLVSVADYATGVPSGAVAVTGGELSRRVRRLLHLPNKEVRDMRGFILPVLLIGVAVLQTVRIERVAAEEARPAEAAAQREGNESPVANLERAFGVPYVIEPPDVLEISGARLEFVGPRKIEARDRLRLRYTGPKAKSDFASALSDDDTLTVDNAGNINLGSGCRFNALGFTIEEADKFVRLFLERELPGSKVKVSLEFADGDSEINRRHLVGPDGRINLGKYGSPSVNGLTLDEAREAVEERINRPSYVSCTGLVLNLFQNNSKKYYIITKGPDFGDNVVTAPITGNETVLDALAAIGGLDGEAKLWIARPAPQGQGAEKTLPIEYESITNGDDTSTNYQLWPGDRLFIKYASAPKPDLPKAADSSRRKHYQVVIRTPAGETVKEIPINGPTRVMDVLSPYRKLAVEIKVWIERRSEGYQEDVRKNVDWNAIAHGDPTTNYHIWPGDRVLIERPAPPAAVPTAAYQAAPLAEGATKTTVRFVSDPDGNLSKAAGLKTARMSTGDTEILLGLLKVLESNDLVEVLAAPSVTAADGAAASVRIGSPGDLMSVETTSHHVEGGVAEIEVRARLETGHIRQFDTAVRLREGQSALICWPKKPNPAGEGDLYLLISREPLE